MSRASRHRSEASPATSTDRHRIRSWRSRVPEADAKYADDASDDTRPIPKPPARTGIIIIKQF
jgi:hypothetical protein